MKRFSLLLLMALGCVSLANAQQPTASPSPAPKPAMSRAQSQKMIIATEQKLWNAWKNKDIKPFRANLTTDSVLVSENGIATKASILEQMGGSNCDVKSFELNDIKVAFVAGNAAIITYKATEDGTCAGQALPAAVWASSTYVMRGGRWMAASHQETVAK